MQHSQIQCLSGKSGIIGTVERSDKIQYTTLLSGTSQVQVLSGTPPTMLYAFVFKGLQLFLFATDVAANVPLLQSVEFF